jgi:hypothetical protein
MPESSPRGTIARKGKRGQDGQNMTAKTEQLRQGKRKKQPCPDSRDMTVGTGQRTTEPGKDREDKNVRT